MFFHVDVEEFPNLDLTQYTTENLKELAYFVWAVYRENEGLMNWRRERLLPLIRVESIAEEE